jgi:PmbA protein
VDYSDTKNELLSIADSGLKYATNIDPEAEFEILLYYRKFAEAKIIQGVIETKDGEMTGNAVRASKGNRVSFACGSGITQERLKSSITESLAIVDKVKVEDDKFEGFLDPTSPGHEGPFSDDILNLTIEDLLTACMSITNEAKETDSKIKYVSSKDYACWGGYAIGNTRGVQNATRYGWNELEAYVLAIENEERRFGDIVDGARNEAFDFQGMGKEAAELAVSLLGAKKLGVTEKLPTIWTPRAAASYLYAGIGQAANGRWIVEQRSPLCDRLGDTIASDELTLVDDGQDAMGFGTYAIDSEGRAQQKNVLVENGVLKTFLFDSYYANAMGVESTGSCARGGSIFGGPPPYEAPPKISIKWLKVPRGNKNLEDLIASINGKGILIMDYPIGIYHSQVSTGDFSVVANSVFLIENGEIKHPLQP